MRRSKVPSVLRKKAAQLSSNQSSQSSSSSDQPLSDQSSFNQTNQIFNRPQIPSSDNQTSNQNFQAFTVVYGTFKPTKKHKEWTDDAILVLEGKSIRVFDLEGECIERNIYTKSKPLKTDDILLLGSKEYMMIDSINKDDFISKRCFQKGFSPGQPQQQSTSTDHSLNTEFETSLKRKFDKFISPLKESTANPQQSDLNLISNYEIDEPKIEQPTKLIKRSNESFNRFESKKENSSSTDDNEKFQAFTCLYGAHKPGKKHKEWSNDGIVIRRNKSIILYNQEGEKIHEECYTKDKQLKENDILMISGKDVQLIDSIDRNEVESKNCFNEGFSVQKPDDQMKMNDTSPCKIAFKSVITNQTKEAIEGQKSRIHNSKKQQSTPWTHEKEESDDENPLEVDILSLPPPPNLFGFQKEPFEICVSYQLTKPLRDHQRDGILFMYKCIMGFHEGISGCLVCDEMGLGKTLQCIVLISTLLIDGPFRVPFFRNRVLILTPSSLVQNWSKEFDKWIKGRKPFYTYSVDGKKNTVKHYLKQNRNTYPVLIISYDMFHRYSDQLLPLEYDLVVCDEGHRLKNCDSKVFKTIRNMKCTQRILLTGTPVQNNLKELFSLSDLVNPGILGTREEFQKNYENPLNIARKRREDSDESIEENSTEREEVAIQGQLFEKISNFFIRRLQSQFNYLPKRVDNILICNLNEIQKEIYEALLNDKNLKKILNDQISTSTSSCFPYISFLRKLCNHPFLVNAEIIKKSYELNENSLIYELSPIVNQIFSSFKSGALKKSGKFDTLVKLLRLIKENDEKVVVVSHFTQTLDLIHEYCKAKNYQTSRLDGSTPNTKRQKLVDEFNSEHSRTTVFLLSSKAGGLGLNLIGASHIILYDIDWNPSHDEQAMARIFRDGQKKTANIYRLLTVGTIEEKIFQRQLDKLSLGASVGNSSNEVQLSNRELKDIFCLNSSTYSTTHDLLGCSKCSATSFELESDNHSTIDRSLENSLLNIFNNQEESNSSNVNVQSNQTNNQMEMEIDTPAYSSFANVKIKKEKSISDHDESSDSSDSDSQESDSDDSDDNSNDRHQFVNIKKENDSFDSDVSSGILDQENEKIEEKQNEEQQQNNQESDQIDNSRSYDDLFAQEESSESINLDLIKQIDNQNTKPVYVDDEERSNDANDEMTNRTNNQPNTNISKPLSEWQHYIYPFEGSDMSAMIYELKDDLKFVFRTEST